jgi:hypothetical protein
MLSNVCVNILDWLDGTDRAPVSAKARFAERSLNLSLVSTHSREDSIADAAVRSDSTSRSGDQFEPGAPVSGKMFSESWPSSVAGGDSLQERIVTHGSMKSRSANREASASKA